MRQLKGLVYSIQRFAIHDGPGIRTLVYAKGCPLRCLWCSSPQSQKATPEILHIELRCKKCGHCIQICPRQAITLSLDNGINIDRELCCICGECVEACPNEALELVGKYVTVDELFEEVKGDSSFYRRSGGGVTLGGGEPTMQHEFATEFLKKCKQNYIHTAIETCGYAIWQKLEKLLQYVDLVYIDLKHMDSTRHKKLTGVPNKVILENATRIAAIRPTIIRIPIIPGYNDSNDNILASARFAVGLGNNLKWIELLPYHKFGTPTYSRLGRMYELSSVEPPSATQLDRHRSIIESAGVTAKIGE